ncbi:MAG: hypothetical protein IPJ49_21050 [Candidatus Obscuribacter sp.]|nr:hypothetical protein [Candidatus Obscuribacter sp.]
MCLSNNRYKTASVSFSGTILLGCEVQVEGKTEHLVGYFNRVQSSAQNPGASDQLLRSSVAGIPSLTAPRRGTRRRSGGSDDFGWETPAKPGKPATIAVGNAMLFALPASPGTVTAANLIAVSDYPSFMQDYARAVSPPVFSDSMRRGGMRGSLGGAKSVEVVKNFDKGTYDVVIAGSAKAIATALDQIDPAKRPIVNSELYAQLDKLYPSGPLSSSASPKSRASKAGCAMVRYKPMKKFEHLLYLPGLDGHNGAVETGQVALDHTLVVGSFAMSKSASAREVHFRDVKFTQDLPFMPTRVVGKVIPAGTMAPQGDFLFKLDELRAGTFRARRALPPGWAKVFGKDESQPFYIQN